ncbi:MAG: hypothetical protein IJH91_06785 [Mogibacterium sp.]|nr:hypothetical protein [Mogibacterium sp.]
MKNPNRTAAERRRASGENMRPETIVIAAGKNDGSCLDYTKMMVDMTGCDAMQYNKKQLGYVALYKNIVFIGAIKEGCINHLNILWQNYSNFDLAGRNLIVCGVGLGDPKSKTYIKRVKHLSMCDQGHCKSFYILPGQLDPQHMKLSERAQFSSFLNKIGEIYDPKDAELIIQRANEGYQGVQRAALLPLVEELKNLK